MSRDVVYRTISLSDFLTAGIELEVKETPISDDVVDLEVVGGTEDGRPFNIAKLPEMLYTLGIVKDHNRQVMAKALHRKMDGKIVDDYRIIGKERSDKAWIQSGYASEEAKLSSSRMRDMVSYTSKLANGGD